MEQVTLSTTESAFLAPSGFVQSASLLGQSGSGFSLMELSSCLTLLVCSSGSFLLPLSVAFPNRLRLPPSGGGTAFTALLRYYSTVRPLSVLYSPFRFGLIGSLMSRCLRDNTASSPGVMLNSSRSCRPHTPCCDGLNEFAFVLIVRTRPSPIFGRPVHPRFPS
jgi:hypothetical protein